MENAKGFVRKQNIAVKIKKRLSHYRTSKHFIVRMTAETIFIIASALFKLKHILTSRQQLEICRIKLFHGSSVHQTTPVTGFNRFPAIFTACRDYFGEKEDIKILSFGCSTGEEVITLRNYFPGATIIGAEINRNSLKICQKRDLDNKIKFIYSTEKNIRNNGPYDAIFCMAVFQRTPQLVTKNGITSLKKLYPFEKFSKQICLLDDCVKKGGLLIVHFSQYDFMDTAAASKYRIWGDCNQDLYDMNSSTFDKDSQLITKKQRRYSIFVKNH